MRNGSGLRHERSACEPPHLGKTAMLGFNKEGKLGKRRLREISKKLCDCE